MTAADVGPAKFTCYLRGKLANHHPRSATIMRVAKSKENAAEHAHLDLVPIEAGQPGGPTCFLQIWEADHFDSYYTDITIGEAPKVVRANRLLGSIPGAIVKRGAGHRFIALGAAQQTHPPDERKGSVTLALEGASGEDQAFELPLPDYEGVLELFALVKLAATAPALVSFRHGKPHQVHNIRATLLHQIEHRGGIHVSIVSDYEFDTAKNNDKEFRRQADAMVSQLPSIILKDGEVAFGRYELRHWKSISDKLEEARTSCQSFLGLPSAPRVGSLGIYGHGVPRAVQLGKDKYDSGASLNIDQLADFVGENRGHFAPTIIIALFACNAARGGQLDRKGMAFRSKKDALEVFGRVPLGEELGGDSYAWHLYRELNRQGIPHPTVWGHTIAAHTTRNRRLRVFSSLGSADLPSLLFNARAPDDATLDAYIDQTEKEIHRLNLIRLVHLQSAFYMPWDWAGRRDAPQPEGYREVTAEEARALLDELRHEICGPGGVGWERPQAVALNEAGTHVIGALVAGPDVRSALSEHFTLEDFTRFEGALPLPLDLVRKLQMLRYEVQAHFELAGLARDPASQEITLTLTAAAPVSSSKRRRWSRTGSTSSTWPMGA